MSAAEAATLRLCDACFELAEPSNAVGWRKRGRCELCGHSGYLTAARVAIGAAS